MDMLQIVEITNEGSPDAKKGINKIPGIRV